MPGALEGRWPFKLIARLGIFQVLLENYMSVLPEVKPDVLGQTTGLSSPSSHLLWWVARVGHVSHGMSQKTLLCLAPKSPQ